MNIKLKLISVLLTAVFFPLFTHGQYKLKRDETTNLYTVYQNDKVVISGVEALQGVSLIASGESTSNNNSVYTTSVVSGLSTLHGLSVV